MKRIVKSPFVYAKPDVIGSVWLLRDCTFAMEELDGGSGGSKYKVLKLILLFKRKCLDGKVAQKVVPVTIAPKDPDSQWSRFLKAMAPAWGDPEPYNPKIKVDYYSSCLAIKKDIIQNQLPGGRPYNFRIQFATDTRVPYIRAITLIRGSTMQDSATIPSMASWGLGRDSEKWRACIMEFGKDLYTMASALQHEEENRLNFIKSNQ